MRVPLEPPGEVSLPPKGLFRTYLRLEGSEPPITVAAASRVSPSLSSAKTFLALAEREGLLVRVDWGRYLPVSPRVALASVLVRPYYRRLWRTHDALSRGGVPHAFACLTASTGADYAPARPIVAVPVERLASMRRADAFGIEAGDDALTGPRGLVRFEWPDGGHAFEAPALRWDWTALVLGAIGLPRELAAARSLLEGRRVGDPLARRLNAFGLSPRKGVLGSEPSVQVPPHVLRSRRQYAESLRVSEAREATRDGR
jgi:hypothetical protein